MRARGESKLRIAVLDLGSTSFHLLVADATPLGEIERVTRRRVMLRLGATISEHGRIPKNVRARAIETAVGLQHLAMKLGAEQFLPVGTAALRDADNGAAVAARMSRELGVPVRILSGEEEARLTLAAFRHRVPFGDETALGLDLGGGSLELAIGDAYGVSWETTLRLGVTRLHNELVHTDPMRGRERKAVRRMVREALAPHLEDLASQRSRHGIACGGTLRALAHRSGHPGDPRRRAPSRGVDGLRLGTARGHDPRGPGPGIGDRRDRQPPMLCTRCLTIERPSPVPPSARERALSTR
jgi:exopolyphosphatase/guanosine-5'-triphosphate,3'-diphosphate pyrophosphatase